MKNKTINKPLRGKSNLPLNEMASYYKFKGDPEEARKAVHDVKSRLKPGVLRDALDKLEKEGEIDLAKLADDRNVDRATYAHPTKQIVFNQDLKDYLQPDTSPYLKQLKQFKKKEAPKPKVDHIYPGKFDIIEKPDGTVELVDKKNKPIFDVPVTKDTSLFDRKTVIKIPSFKWSDIEKGWSEDKREEGTKLKDKWRFTLVDKGIMSFDEQDSWKTGSDGKRKSGFKISNDAAYKKELEKFIPKYIKQMSLINENKSLKPTMKRSEFKKLIREEIIAALSETIMVDKTTDINKVNDIARQEKKDPNTIRTAITQAKTSGKPITIAEFNGEKVPAELIIEKSQLDYLKSRGVKESLNGRVLFFPLSIVHDLQQRESPRFQVPTSPNQSGSSFKQGFIDAGSSKRESYSRLMLSSFTKLLKQSSTDSKGNTYYALQGKLSSSNTFYFNNPFKK